MKRTMKKAMILLAALTVMLCMLLLSGCELLESFSPGAGSGSTSPDNVTNGDVISTEGSPLQTGSVMTGPTGTWHPDYKPSESGSAESNGELPPKESESNHRPHEKPIVHEFVNRYKYDYDNHWRYCNHCDEVADLAPHELNERGRCNVCNFRVDARLLIIESIEGESDALVESLDGNVMVDVMQISSEERFPLKSGEMSNYDGVILVNVSRENMPKGFEDGVLRPYLQKFGGNMLTVCGNKKGADNGGDPEVNAFTPGDMDGSIYGELLPVEIVERSKSAAVMFVVDISFAMFDPTDGGDYENSRLYMASELLYSAIDSLDGDDCFGVMAYSGDVIGVMPMTDIAEYDGYRPDLLKIADGGIRYGLSNAIGRAGVMLGDMSDVEVKHIIVISDGQYPENDESELLNKILQNADDGITLSYVGIKPGDSADGEIFGKLDEYLNEEKADMFSMKSLDGAEGIIDEIRAKFLCDNIAEAVTFVPGAGKSSTIFDGVDPEDVPALGGYYFCKLKNGAQAVLTYGEHPIYARWTLEGGARVGSFMCELGGPWSAEFLKSDAGQRIVNNIIKDLFIYKK